MLELLQWPVFQRALAAGILVGFLASYFGVFVVQRRLALMGVGLAHAAFGGVALGILLGLEPLYVALPFTMAVAAGMVWVQERTQLAADTTIGIFFAVSMALGIIFLALKEGPTGDAFALLFGSILAVQRSDLWFAGGAVALTLLAAPLWRTWAYATFDRQLAATDRLPVRRHDYLLTMSMAAVVVISIKIVGILLIAAFLVLPPATARLLAPTFAVMTVISVILGCGTVVAGLVLAYFLDLPASAVIILLQAALFFTVLLLSGLRR